MARLKGGVLTATFVVASLHVGSIAPASAQERQGLATNDRTNAAWAEWRATAGAWAESWAAWFVCGGIVPK
jgi:poly(3-hydroxyalkanoate) synthetase